MGDYSYCALCVAYGADNHCNDCPNNPDLDYVDYGVGYAEGYEHETYEG